VHRTHPQRFDQYGNRLLSFHREHGISDNRAASASTPPPVRFATLRAVPPAARVTRTRLLLRLIACLVLGMLAGATFEMVVIETLVRPMQQVPR